jgi:hypothetical protein
VAITHKVFTSRNNNLDQATYVGEAGRLFYAQTTGTGHAPTLRYSDGSTPGGLPLSGGSLTFSGSLPTDNPVDGNLWWNTVDGRLYVYYESSWVDASPEANTAIPQAITSTTGTSTATNLTVDLSGPTFVHWQPSDNGNRTITLTGFTPGRKVEMFITPHNTNDVFTVSGVTASQCSNGVNTFTMQGVGTSTQNSFMLQLYCTTSDISGVWIYGNGSV